MPCERHRTQQRGISSAHDQSIAVCPDRLREGRSYLLSGKTFEMLTLMLVKGNQTVTWRSQPYEEIMPSPNIHKTGHDPYTFVYKKDPRF